MSYEFDVFVSYRRAPTTNVWVHRHFLPLFVPKLNNIADRTARVFCDTNMENGVRLSSELRSKIRGSAMLLAVWSADYFRSAWCMTEWESFRRREKMLGLFSDQHPESIIYPICYADGKFFHKDAKKSLCRADFSDLNYVGEAFSASAKFIDFEDRVMRVAEDIAARLCTLPAWKEKFPIVTKRSMPPVSHPRPVI